MKLALFLGVLVGGYCYMLLHLADMATNQVAQLGKTYQSVANDSEELMGQ